MLSIRRFMQGADEAIWVKVLNAAYKEHETWWRATTAEEMLLEEKRPNFDLEGRFIAEFDRKPVGIIHAHVDKLRKEKKGFINTFCVIPEFRGRGVEEELAELAINELRRREMDGIEAWTDSERSDRIQLLERLGFKLVRKWSDMEINLSDIPFNIGENKQVTLRLLQEGNEDLRTLNWLGNECFREHFDYRPTTIEETRYSLYDNPKWREQTYFFALQNQEIAGYIGVGIDEKYNTEKNVKSGFILTIGVLKQYRRKGVGTKLMLQALESLKAKGMTKAMLDVDDRNLTKAIKLYAKVGFKVVKKYSIYEKELRAHNTNS